MNVVNEKGGCLEVSTVFNEEYAGQLIGQVKAPFHTINFNNVGIKIMQQVIQHFVEVKIRRVQLSYNWNDIMVYPKLVCYDKNQWKTLQQLKNWNQSWNQLFKGLYDLEEVQLNITCSWMDEQFVKAFLEGIILLPNIKSVQAHFSSKNVNVENVLSAFSAAKIFPSFEYKFSKYE